MKAEDVYKRVKQHFINHEHKMLNKYIFDWESDYFCVSKSGYCVEVEVKVSKGDFRVDFEKQKHQLFKKVLYKDKYWVQRCGQWRGDWYIDESGNRTLSKCSSISIVEVEKQRLPNKFWYAMPEGLIQPKDIPPYAGLIFVLEEGGYEIVKDAPFIHKRKMNLPELLFDKYSWGYQSQASEIERLKFEVWQANEKVKNLSLQLKVA